MTERTLILLRHGKSDRSGDEDDIARPLSDRGRRQAPEAGRWLNENAPRVDLAIVSPAVRARTTWDLVATELDSSPPVQTDDRVYANTAGDLLAAVRDAPDAADTVVMVGHNPGLEDLVTQLTGESIELSTSAVAVIEVPDTWANAGAGSGVLRSQGRPPSG
jgi:phosphohistidine phosphatase